MAASFRAQRSREPGTGSTTASPTRGASVWCAAPAGMQEALVQGEPEHYFVPPYVGHRGWVGVHLNRGLDWNEIAGAIEEAYLTVAPKRLAEQAIRARG